jgi:hypothetical protein
LSLYLAIFEEGDHDDEIAAVEVGPYSKFGEFRDDVARLAEAGRRGSRFPTLMNHADSDGVWTPEDAVVLIRELLDIERSTPAIRGHVDIEGVPLVESLRQLAKRSVDVGRPIEFQ